MIKDMFWYIVWAFLRTYGYVRQLQGAYLNITPGGKPYLFRIYLTPRGNWYRKRFPAWFLHRFDDSDSQRGTHSHPWLVSSSRILRGSYMEHRPLLSEAKNPDGTLIETTRMYYPGDVNIITRNDFHRVRLLAPKVWTLFVAGEFHGKEWEFMDDYGNRRPHGTETRGD